MVLGADDQLIGGTSFTCWPNLSASSSQVIKEIPRTLSEPLNQHTYTEVSASLSLYNVNEYSLMCAFVPLHVCLKNAKQHNGSGVPDNKVLDLTLAVRRVSAIILLTIWMGGHLEKQNQFHLRTQLQTWDSAINTMNMRS